MSFESYFFNISKAPNGWVSSFDQPSARGFPIFGNTDNRDFGVTFLQNIGADAVEVVQAVVGAQVAISDPATPGTVITSATASSPTNNVFPFLLAINGFTTFLGSSVVPKVAALEFLITTASGGKLRYGTSVYIKPQQLSDATPDTTASSPTATLADIAALAVTKEVPPGMPWIWTDETDGAKFRVRCVNRQFTFEPLG